MSREPAAPLAATRPLDIARRRQLDVVFQVLALAVLCLALTANAMFLGSALTTEGDLIAEPESVKGLNRLDDRVPERDEISELVVVRAAGPRVSSMLRGKPRTTR